MISDFTYAIVHLLAIMGSALVTLALILWATCCIAFHGILAPLLHYIKLANPLRVTAFHTMTTSHKLFYLWCIYGPNPDKEIKLLNATSYRELPPGSTSKALYDIHTAESTLRYDQCCQPPAETTTLDNFAEDLDKLLQNYDLIDDHLDRYRARRKIHEVARIHRSIVQESAQADEGHLVEDIKMLRDLAQKQDKDTSW